MGRGVYRNYCKGHKDKINEEGGGGAGRWVLAGLGWRDGEKMQTSVTEQQCNKKRKKKKTMSNLKKKHKKLLHKGETFNNSSNKTLWNGKNKVPAHCIFVDSLL